MVVYVVRRLLYSIPVLFVASFLIFTFVSISVDPLDAFKMDPRVNDENLVRLAEERHLNDPVVVRYGYWLKDAFTNEFGTTIVGDRPVLPEITRVLPNTLQLVLAAEIVTLLGAILLGVYSAIRQYSWFDYSATALSFVGIATPVFWIALILQIIFTNIYLKYDVRVFYTAQISSVDPGEGLGFFVDRAQHLALPVIALSIATIAAYSRFVRGSMLEVINSDYVRTARAKGLVERRVILKHAFRNALIPLVTLIGLDIGTLFGGAVITETIFAIDGMGRFFINALGTGETYSIMAWLMVTATMVVVGNLIADIAYGYLDPRVRYD